MKARVLFFSALVMTLGLFSCSKDNKDDDDSGTGGNQSKLILGSWDIYEVSYISYEDGEKTEEGTEQVDLILEIKEDNTYTLTEGDDIDSGNYTVSNGKLIIISENDEVPEEMTILKLDAKDFHFRGDYTDTFEGVEYRYVETYRARR